MLRAILFDMGGTLDGDGVHWLDRFVECYAASGLAMSRSAIRYGFDEAERRAQTDPDIAHADLDTMVRQHVAWQFEVHQLDDPGRADAIASLFTRPVRDTARRNASVLSVLRGRSYVLGVVSNGCGNVDVLCDDLGYAPHLSTIVDSRRAGVSKPDPAIFRLALDRIGIAAADTMMVGDSYARDIVPAHALGMRTAWLAPADGDGPAADVRLVSLADLPSSLPVRERTPA